VEESQPHRVGRMRPTESIERAIEKQFLAALSA
jgi:hypothetical protein